jgi:phosphate transport system substrate-binding protein
MKTFKPFKSFKKAMALIMALVLTLVITGCGKQGFDESGKISVISREDGSGTRGAFIELFGIEEKGDDGTKTDKTTKEAVIVKQTDVMMTNIKNDANAIGYISLGSLNDTVKALQIDGAVASSENVKNGSYKVSRPFYVATKDEPTGIAADFLDFIMSKQGQEVVGKSYIAVSDSAAEYSGEKPSGKVVVAGSSSVTPIMEKLKEAYIVLNPNATIEIQMTDSTSGLTSAIDGTCDIAMASRELKEKELETLVPTQIAIDGIAVIVNKENTTAGLTSDQIKGIFTGNVTTWKDVK